MKRVQLGLLAFLLHFLLVQFGELFTIPLGFSSPIWPVSGVILGLYLCFGTPILIGALSSILLCFFQETLNSELPASMLALTSLISILQLLISKKLVERFCILPVRVYIPMQIIKFLVLTGPLAVLVTSTLSVFVLGIYLPIELNSLMYLGMVMWVGNFMSIVFITPIILFTVTNTFVKKARHTAVATVASIVSLTAISIIYIISNQYFMQEKTQRFVNSTELFTAHVKGIETNFKQNLQALDGLFQSSDFVNRNEFKTFIDKIKSNTINIRAISWLPLVEHSERKSFESSLKSLNLNLPHISALTDEGVIKAPEQDNYLPIYFIEPFDENKSAIGLDVSSHPIVKGSVNEAINKRLHIMTPLVSLVQQHDKYTGVIIYYPIYKKQNSEKEEKFTGLVEVVFELDKLLDGFYQQSNVDSFHFSFSYGNGNRYDQPGYTTNAVFAHNVNLHVFDKQAVITFSSTPSFELSLTDWFSLIVMILGCFFGVICVMFLFFIVTFNFSLARKVEESTEKLTQKNEELLIANRAKNLFLANISHEYRTPLNAIIGFSEIAQRETTDEAAKDYLDKISHSSDILLNIVNDVLDISKIQAGELSLESRAFMPSQVTIAVIGMLQSKAKEQLITLEYDFTPGYSLWVNGDDTRFKQIIINLLNNAIKFTRKGRVKIFGDCHKADDNTCLLTLSIEDTGIGISKENQQYIFTPFAQAETSTTRKYGGTGIGLSIVKQLCLMMGGDISLSSKLGEGSLFTVTLALAIAEKPAVTSEKEVLNDASARTYKGSKILVVEDNKINQLIVQKQLSPLEVHCDFANDGELALKCLEQSTPDLILMDLQMPVMDGFTASSIIKKTPLWQHIPIVILSASVGKEDKHKALELGIEEFINKPFQQEDLIRVLAKYIEKTINNTE